MNKYDAIVIGVHPVEHEYRDATTEQTICNGGNGAAGQYRDE